MSEKEKLLDEVEKEINEFAQPYSCIVEKEGQLVEKEVWAIGVDVIEDIIKQFKRKIKKEESKKVVIVSTRQNGKSQLLKINLEKIQNEKAIAEFENLKKKLRGRVCLMENGEHCYPQRAITWEDIVNIISASIKNLQGENFND